MSGVLEHPGPIEPREADPARETVADLLDRLGGISADRVLLNPAPGTATEADLLKLPGDIQRLCELIDGTLVVKVMGAPESAVASCLMMFLAPFVLKHKLIVVLGPDGHTRYFGDQIRMPDVAVILRSRLPDGRLPDEQICPVAPDLAVEVLSPRNPQRELDLKLKTYFESGVRLVWVVDPRRRLVRVYTAVESCTQLREDDALDASEILPGFSLSVREWLDAAG
jgi:Uma2 family endonuclease